jgi:hypothetical protein
MLAKLTGAQCQLSVQPVVSIRCVHCDEQLPMTYIDLLWRKVYQRFWFDIEIARFWYSEELYFRGLLREYDAKGLEKAGHR